MAGELEDDGGGGRALSKRLRPPPQYGLEKSYAVIFSRNGLSFCKSLLYRDTRTIWAVDY